MGDGLGNGGLAGLSRSQLGHHHTPATGLGNGLLELVAPPAVERHRGATGREPHTDLASDAGRGTYYEGLLALEPWGQKVHLVVAPLAWALGSATLVQKMSRGGSRYLVRPRSRSLFIDPPGELPQLPQVDSQLGGSLACRSEILAQVGTRQLTELGQRRAASWSRAKL